MNYEFITALEDLERERGIDMEVLIEAIEAALISAYRRNFGSAEDVDVHIDRDSGDIRVIARKTVVEEVEDESTEISLEDARQVDSAYDLGDEAQLEVTPGDFGRIAATTARQVVVQRLREAERGMIYEEFVDREGDIVTGVVRRVQGRNVFVDLGRTEAILLPSEQIPGEYYRQGERIKAYIVEVKRTTRGPQIVLSRSHPGLLKRLFELEVPEIHEGLVEIKEISREAGGRSKVAVSSREFNVDPVGACVGPRGSRVQSVVNELKGEKIDIIRWSEDTEDYLANSLSPARVVHVITNPEDKTAEVIVPDDQLSLAIGREGQNVRLAAKLTGWKIDIKSEREATAVLGESGQLGEIWIPGAADDEDAEAGEGELIWSPGSAGDLDDDSGTEAEAGAAEAEDSAADAVEAEDGAAEAVEAENGAAEAVEAENGAADAVAGAGEIDGGADGEDEPGGDAHAEMAGAEAGSESEDPGAEAGSESEDTGGETGPAEDEHAEAEAGGAGGGGSAHGP